MYAFFRNRVDLACWRFRSRLIFFRSSAVNSAFVPFRLEEVGPFLAAVAIFGFSTFVLVAVEAAVVCVVFMLIWPLLPVEEASIFGGTAAAAAAAAAI